MRAVVQRVTKALMEVDGRTVASIGRGLVAYVGFGPGDDAADFQYMTDKIRHLRVFEDGDGKMNLSVEDLGLGILFVPNFTLYGDCRRGRRPSYSGGAPVEEARGSFAAFIQYAKDQGVVCEQGIFQADMQIEQHCDGPVTLLLDSKRTF